MVIGFLKITKISTKNLGAESLSKVQVYDEKTLLEKYTGYQRGRKEKVMNLKLKKEFSKSSFGTVGAGLGTNERMTVSGLFNLFSDKYQLSFVGLADNTKEADVGENSYQSFKGEGSSFFSENGDFGFEISGQSAMMAYPLDLPIPVDLLIITGEVQAITIWVKKQRSIRVICITRLINILTSLVAGLLF